ncbi:hypothetical protein CYMTET_12199 [Cymbomonas tetramitiformis]|uniref:Uncharacterized protein n=1 Tax=Cymbomonas tetramitiformis TaxID=36881 RepID=A0AAE0GKJ5_9CHLO|nr:hypothetical protein CYMTET_12199 [Cymbomonas tetramitiformis]
MDDPQQPPPEPLRSSQHFKPSCDSHRGAVAEAKARETRGVPTRDAPRKASALATLACSSPLHQPHADVPTCCAHIRSARRESSCAVRWGQPTKGGRGDASQGPAAEEGSFEGEPLAAASAGRDASRARAGRRQGAPCIAQRRSSGHELLLIDFCAACPPPSSMFVDVKRHPLKIEQDRRCEDAE